MPNSGTDTEQFKAEAEARYWNRVTNGDPQAVKYLMERVTMRRGKEAAGRLLELMRVEWRKGR